jgi:hypothetical protein
VRRYAATAIIEIVWKNRGVAGAVVTAVVGLIKNKMA